MFGIVQTIGWPIWPLILVSVIALALVVERVLALRRHRIAPPNLLKDVTTLVARRQISGEVLDKLHANSCLGQIFAAGIRQAGSTRAQISQAMELAGGHVAHEMSRYLSLLGAIGSVAPLLGLLGTVVGMIDIFSSQQGGTNPQQLAQGISTALYSTAFGIIVAVPSVLAYRLLKSRVDDFLVDMEREGQELVELLEAAAAAENRAA